MSVHDGHRQRVKRRFRTEGLDNFDDLHIVELMLFCCVPRKDTNILAHNLMERFGSLNRILEAKPEELEKVDGITENIATVLSLFPAVNRACIARRNQNVTTINTYGDAGRVIQNELAHLRNECVCLLCLDARKRILCIERFGEGSINSAGVPVRRIVERAISANATFAILGHNHPGGNAIPSDEDISTTQYIAKALWAVDIHLADHIIVADDSFVSMTQSGFYRPEVDRRMP